MVVIISYDLESVPRERLSADGSPNLKLNPGIGAFTLNPCEHSDALMRKIVKPLRASQDLSQTPPGIGHEWNLSSRENFERERVVCDPMLSKTYKPHSSSRSEHTPCPGFQARPLRPWRQRWPGGASQAGARRSMAVEGGCRDSCAGGLRGARYAHASSVACPSLFR